MDEKPPRPPVPRDGSGMLGGDVLERIPARPGAPWSRPRTPGARPPRWSLAARHPLRPVALWQLQRLDDSAPRAARLARGCAGDGALRLAPLAAVLAARVLARSPLAGASREAPPLARRPRRGGAAPLAAPARALRARHPGCACGALRPGSAPRTARDRPGPPRRCLPLEVPERRAGRPDRVGRGPGAGRPPRGERPRAPLRDAPAAAALGAPAPAPRPEAVAGSGERAPGSRRP